MGMILGLVGFADCGKGTVGDFMVQNHGFVEDSFAKSLKDATAAIFGWDRELLEGNTDKSRFWREQRDRFWAEALENGFWEQYAEKKNHFTPRVAMQVLGTQGCRQLFGENIWVQTVMRRWLEAKQPNTVIKDCRFPNEVKMIRENGGKVVRIQRGPEPHFYNLMLFYNRGMCDEEDIKMIKQMKSARSIPHESETAWIGCDVDEYVENNGSLEELEVRVREVVEQLTDAETQYTLSV